MLFTFIYKRKSRYWEDILKYPFRVGDIVKVKNWGKQYTTYDDAFLQFGVNKDNQFLGIIGEYGDNTEFKIKALARHSANNRTIICCLESRDKKWAVVGADGLTLVKQYPLRKRNGETKEIHVVEIKSR